MLQLALTEKGIPMNSHYDGLDTDSLTSAPTSSLSPDIGDERPRLSAEVQAETAGPAPATADEDGGIDL